MSSKKPPPPGPVPAPKPRNPHVAPAAKRKAGRHDQGDVRQQAEQALRETLKRLKP